MEWRFWPKEEREPNYVIKIDEQIEQMMHWTFKHIEKLRPDAKERILDFYVFYMQQRGWKFDWKVWKEIDLGTELEEFNKKLEAAPVEPVLTEIA